MKTPTKAFKIPTFPAWKPVSMMMPSEINKKLEWLRAVDNKLCDEMIRSGRGNELPFATMKLDDPLSKAIKRAYELNWLLRNEIEKRCGTSTYYRDCPKFAKPLKAI